MRFPGTRSLRLCLLLCLAAAPAPGGWQRQPSGTSNYLYAVTFVGPSTGWVAGQAGTILHTTGGGMRWEAQTSGTGNFLYDIAFIDGSRRAPTSSASPPAGGPESDVRS
jgi:hypothetical protein